MKIVAILTDPSYTGKDDMLFLRAIPICAKMSAFRVFVPMFCEPKFYQSKILFWVFVLIYSNISILLSFV